MTHPQKMNQTRRLGQPRLIQSAEKAVKTKPLTVTHEPIIIFTRAMVKKTK